VEWISCVTRRSAMSRTASLSVRTVPRRRTSCGMTLCASDEVLIVQTDTTMRSIGSVLRLATV
jgi:hypothetical protein